MIRAAAFAGASARASASARAASMPRAAGVASSVAARRFSAAAGAGASDGADAVERFVTDALASKGITGDGCKDVLAKLKTANVASFDLLKSLNMHDWEKTGVSVGAARAIQDALWQSKYEQSLEKVERQLNLRRESSTRAISKQKRL